MQREEAGYIVISCDFTGIDWDNERAMIEGHRGSVICLEALAQAVDEAGPAEQPFQCSMCLREFDPPEVAWRCADPPHPDHANPEAVICWDCIQQADRAFGKDPDVDWQRRISPSKRWR